MLKFLDGRLYNRKVGTRTQIPGFGDQCAIQLHHRPKKEMRAGFEPTITGLHYNRTGRLTTWLPHHILYLI